MSPFWQKAYLASIRGAALAPGRTGAGADWCDAHDIAERAAAIADASAAVAAERDCQSGSQRIIESQNDAE